MYQKYQTDALVLGSYELGEADKTLVLFTRDFGLVRARASAIRTEKSKMRSALQDYAQANVSLVRGKRGWRAAGARAGRGFSDAIHPKSMGAMARISELVTRLVGGEEKNEYLYETLAGARSALLSGTSSETVEILCVARILYSLGYLSVEALETVLFTHADYGVLHAQEAEIKRDKLLASINHAISETQLIRR
jgi:DNA repair protein RecO (recombination protein O)